MVKSYLKKTSQWGVAFYFTWGFYIYYRIHFFLKHLQDMLALFKILWAGFSIVVRLNPTLYRYSRPYLLHPIHNLTRETYPLPSNVTLTRPANPHLRL